MYDPIRIITQQRSPSNSTTQLITNTREPMKKAFLVRASFVTRIVVDENATEQEKLEAAAIKISEKATYEFTENLESIEEDTESPYDPEEEEPNV